MARLSTWIIAVTYWLLYVWRTQNIMTEILKMWTLYRLFTFIASGSMPSFCGIQTHCRNNVHVYTTYACFRRNESPAPPSVQFALFSHVWATKAVKSTPLTVIVEVLHFLGRATKLYPKVCARTGLSVLHHMRYKNYPWQHVCVTCELENVSQAGFSSHGISLSDTRTRSKNPWEQDATLEPCSI